MFCLPQGSAARHEPHLRYAGGADVSASQYPGQVPGSSDLKIKSSNVVRHGTAWVVDSSDAGVSPSGFLDYFFLGSGPCGTGPPSPLERIPAPPLVTAVLIAPKGAESPGSGRMGV